MIRFDPSRGEFNFEVKLDKAVIDGEIIDEGVLPVDELEMVTQGRLQRPVNKNTFAELCVEKGESVFWIPQDQSAAATAIAPFLGWNNDVESGLFVEDKIHLYLVSAQSQPEGGHFAMWRNDFLAPEVHMTTCDGISEADRLTLPQGHDHRGMSFSGEPGRWEIVFEVRATSATDNTEYRTRLPIVFVTQAKDES